MVICRVICLTSAWTSGRWCHHSTKSAHFYIFFLSVSFCSLASCVSSRRVCFPWIAPCLGYCACFLSWLLFGVGSLGTTFAHRGYQNLGPLPPAKKDGRRGLVGWLGRSKDRTFGTRSDIALGDLGMVIWQAGRVGSRRSFLDFEGVYGRLSVEQSTKLLDRFCRAG